MANFTLTPAERCNSHSVFKNLFLYWSSSCLCPCLGYTLKSRLIYIYSKIAFLFFRQNHLFLYSLCTVWPSDRTATDVLLVVNWLKSAEIIDSINELKERPWQIVQLVWRRLLPVTETDNSAFALFIYSCSQFLKAALSQRLSITTSCGWTCRCNALPLKWPVSLQSILPSVITSPYYSTLHITLPVLSRVNVNH